MNNSSNTTKLIPKIYVSKAGTQFFRFLTRLNDAVSRKRS